MIKTHLAVRDVTPNRATVQAFGSHDDCSDYIVAHGDDTWQIVSYQENYPEPAHIVGTRIWLVTE